MPAALVLTIAYLAALSFTPDFLIGTPEYKWPVLKHGQLSRLPLAALVMALASAASLLLFREVKEIAAAKWGRAKIFAALFLIGAGFQTGPALVHKMGAIELPLRVYLPDHTSYFTDAAKIGDAGEWARNFPKNVKNMATHTRTHPPGATLLFLAVQRMMERTPALSEAYVDHAPRSAEAMKRFGLSPSQVTAGAFSALLLFLASASAAPLTFAIARIMMDDKSALLATALFAAGPVFAHKTPVLDHLLGVIILLSLWLCLSAVRHKHMWRIGLAGLLMGTGVWMGTAVLAALPLCAAYLAAAFFVFAKKDVSYARLAVLLACCILVLMGAALFSITLVGVVLGVGFPEVYAAITETGWYNNNTVSGRVHSWMWIAFNHYEVLAWAGVPVAIMFIVAVVRTVNAARQKRFSSVDPFLVALVVFLLALNFSGKVCYEAARLTWFCFPLIAMAGAREAAAEKSGWKLPAALVAMQSASTLVFRMIF